MRALSREEVVRRFKVAHGNRYSYERMKFVNTRTKVEIICPIHGPFTQYPRRHMVGDGCPLCYAESQKSLICGFGVNDLARSSNDKCYDSWLNMIRRCYNPKNQGLHPSYIGCSICDEWRYLSNFKAWFDANYVEGYQLDKDILVKGNKVYSPETCCFIPQEINKLFTNRKQQRGKYPIGVVPYRTRFSAVLSVCRRNTHIGVFDTPEAAFLAYKKAKEQYIKELAEKYYKEGKITERVYLALLAYRVEITD